MRGESPAHVLGELWETRSWSGRKAAFASHGGSSGTRTEKTESVTREHGTKMFR